MKLGLHQEPRVHSPQISFTEAEVRKRLWVTLLEISLQASLDSGLPAIVFPESFDTEVPSNVNDADLSTPQPFSLSVPSRPRTTFTHSTVQILLAETQRTRLEVLQLVNSPGTNLTYHEALKLAAKLSRACNANLRLMQSLSLSSPSEGIKPTEFQIKILDTWTRRFLLALLSPYADQAQTNHAFYYARKARMEASALLLSYPLSPKMTISPDDHYTQLRISGEGIFRNVLRQATCAVCRDLIDDLTENAFPVTDRENRRKLYKVVQKSVAIYDQRVQAAQSTTQEYVAFLCATTQIDSMQPGRDELQDMGRAAMTGLERCCAALETAHQRDNSIELTSSSEEAFISWGDLLS